MASNVSPDTLALQRMYHWEKTTPNRVALTQPLGGGQVRDYTWAEVMDQARRMAAHLKTLGLEPGARVALIAKNTAHWMMSDYAIWLAGYVSVPLYPTLAAGTIRQILEHSEARLLFVGKLDGWAGMKPGIPAGLPCIPTRSHPTTPRKATPPGTTSPPRPLPCPATPCVTATSSAPSCTPRARLARPRA